MRRSIITNCLVMGRADAMAKTVSPLPAFLDGLGAGVGYAWVLIFVASIREIFGFGQWFGMQVIPLSWYATPENPDAYADFGLMVTPPAAFFILGGMIWVANITKKKT